MFLPSSSPSLYFLLAKKKKGERREEENTGRLGPGCSSIAPKAEHFIPSLIWGKKKEKKGRRGGAGEEGSQRPERALAGQFTLQDYLLIAFHSFREKRKEKKKKKGERGGNGNYRLPDSRWWWGGVPLHADLYPAVANEQKGKEKRERKEEG